MTPATIQALKIVTIVVASTMVGNETAMAVFFHPRISRLEDAAHVRAAQTLASALGTVMPFCYALTVPPDPRRDFPRTHGVERAAVAGARLRRAFRQYDSLHRASASAH
jgi:hypothetical protein